VGAPGHHRLAAADQAAARAGVGIGALHDNLARRAPQLIKVPIAPLKVWLVVHQDVRANAAVRAVLAALERALRDDLDAWRVTGLPRP
jgi:DNA-binding transcriptional LysR family regulator